MIDDTRSVFVEQGAEVERGIREVSLEIGEAGVRREPREVATLQGDVVIGGETVDPDDRVAAPKQPLREMGADETGAPRDQGDARRAVYLKAAFMPAKESVIL